MASLTVNNLSVSIENNNILNNISFSANSGEVTAIIGENGIGKTTLLKNIVENIKNEKIITFNATNKKVSYVPQFREFNEEIPLSVYDFLTLPLKQKLIPWLSKKEKNIIQNAIELLEISDLSSKRIGTLSGGERQRVFLAQALINNPQILLLDEFTSNLDKKSERECMELITKITKKYNVITLCITHELSLVDEKYVDKILYLYEKGYKYISIEDYKKQDHKEFKLCRHYIGE